MLCDTIKRKRKWDGEWDTTCCEYRHWHTNVVLWLVSLVCNWSSPPSSSFIGCVRYSCLIWESERVRERIRPPWANSLLQLITTSPNIIHCPFTHQWKKKIQDCWERKYSNDETFFSFFLAYPNCYNVVLCVGCVVGKWKNVVSRGSDLWRFPLNHKISSIVDAFFRVFFWDSSLLPVPTLSAFCLSTTSCVLYLSHEPSDKGDVIIMIIIIIIIPISCFILQPWDRSALAAAFLPFHKQPMNDRETERKYRRTNLHPEPKLYLNLNRRFRPLHQMLLMIIIVIIIIVLISQSLICP